MRIATLATLLVALLTTPVREVRAQEAESGEDADATHYFTKGSQLFLAHQYAEALDALRASYRITPSPSSGLLIARCLQQLGRSVEASEMYATVEADARQRPDPDGEYAKTADAAAHEGASVRATLASIRVHVAHASEATRLEIDSAPVALAASGDVLVWHMPGAVSVTLRSAVGSGGADQHRELRLLAGSDVRLELEATPTPPPPVAALPFAPLPLLPSEREVSSRPWALPAALGSGLVAAAGIGIFAGFGAASHAKYEDLSRSCGPHACGSPSERAQVENGQRQQTIANVGFVVGAVGVAATAVFVALHLTASDERRPASAHLVVSGGGGGGGAVVYGAFE